MLDKHFIVSGPKSVCPERCLSDKENIFILTLILTVSDVFVLNFLAISWDIKWTIVSCQRQMVNWFYLMYLLVL